MKHDVVSAGGDDDKVKPSEDDALLAYMAGRTSSVGDIRQVLAAANSAPDKKNKNHRKVNASEYIPDTVQVGDTTYYLNKGETINIQAISIRHIWQELIIVSANMMLLSWKKHLSMGELMVVYAVMTC
jgi:protein required for attachment to host cells